MRLLQATTVLLLVSSGAENLLAQDTQAEAKWHFLDRATIPDPSPAMPAHVRMLYTDEIDMIELERAYRAYYAGKDADAPFEDLERDPWAKFFHQWYRAAQDFIDDEGIIRVMTTSELLAYRAEQASTDGYAGSESAAGSSWSFVGPRRTVWREDHNAAQPTAPWQVNVYCIAIAPSNPSILYCGSETGCLYKSVDKGLSWTPFNDFNWSRAILSVAIHPTDPDIVYAGTSNDIYKTIDGGASWSIVLTESGLSCNSLAISLAAPDTLLAGSANGLYRSADAGGSWTEVVAKHVDDVTFRPGDGSTVYALTRTGSPDTYSFYKSTDAGLTFSLAMTGWGTLYEQSGGRIAVTPADPDYIYAVLLTHDGSGNDAKPYILKSTDAAGSWTNPAVCNSGPCALNNGQGYYDLAIVASHADPERVIAATTTAYRSTNGGANWSAVGGYTGPFSIHPDIQSMVSIMDGTTENTWIATDGGANFSTDFYSNTANWEARIDGLDGTDFWGFAQGWNEDYLVGGRYHNGNTAIHENYPDKRALRLGGAESVTGWALHGRERHAAFDDISELIIPDTIDGEPEGSFLFSKHPQNYYYGDAFSRVMVDLEDFMTVYLGEGQSFWRSIDGGGSWEATHTFSGKPYHFDISRADGDYIYLAADDGFHRSTDRGESFTEMTLPTGLGNWHSQNLRVAASSTDRDTVWVLNQRATANSSIGRVFISEDGGASWTDWTTPTVTGQKWLAMAHQAGTDGGIYIASKRGAAGVKPARVLYRDRTMSDWVDWSAGLPDSANPIKLLPFYRDGKLRWGGNRGAWEIDFYEQDWTPIAQPFVSGKTQICIRDVVELDSYSVADASATYSWTVPGADWTSDLEQREVQATFPSTGTYTATLTVTQGSHVDSKSVDILVENHCDPDPSPGNAIALSGESSDWAATSRALDITTNTMTISAWIKRDGQQADYSGVVFMRQGTACGLNFRNHRILGFHWNNGQWGWNSGLIVPNNEWAHVAMVVTPTETTLYVNGVSAVNTVDPVPCTFDGVMNFGADPNWGARRFKGEMDEVLIYDRALSGDEIRELMYLTRDPAGETGLLGYWQFNRPEGVITDRVGTNHASLLGGAVRVPSSAPIGPGVSARANVTGAGDYTFGATGLTLGFPADGSVFPGGDVWVTRIDHAPHRLPSGAFGDSYWIVDNFGSNATFDELEHLTFTGLDVSGTQARFPSQFQLRKRDSNAHGPTWGYPVDRADAATPGNPGSVTFERGNRQTSFGQFLLSFDPPAERGATEK